jgi:hypothetical protein
VISPVPLHELHRLVVSELLRCVKAGEPSAELLHVARSLLRDNQVQALEPRDVARLRRLHALLAQRLEEALSAPMPPAAVLAEARKFLKDNNVTKDHDSATETRQAVQSLSSLDLPFTSPH